MKKSKIIENRYFKSHIFIAGILLIILVGLLANRGYFTDVRKLSTMNHTSDYGDIPEEPYLSFQIKYPNSYFATSRDMYTSYRSQGGAGFPDIVLTKGVQFTNDKVEQQSLMELEKSGTDCIFVTSYLNFVVPGIDNDEVSLNGRTILEPDSTKYGRFGATIRKLTSTDNKEYYDAYVSFPENVNYYFETCNDRNKQDLITVLENFDIRGKE